MRPGSADAVVTPRGALTVCLATAPDLDAAIEVWRSANLARGLPPSQDRLARVRDKLSADDACVVVGWMDGRIIAMALAEPGREDNGAGPVVPGLGHVSMVFVHPDTWGLGFGKTLLRRLHEQASLLGWTRTSLWTRASNERARRLYESEGYQPTGQASTLDTGDQVIHLERRATTATKH